MLVEVYKDFSALFLDAVQGVAAPVRERIVDNVVNVIQNITVAGGYSTDVRRVLRSVGPGSELQEYPCVVLIEETEDISVQPGQAPTGLMSCRLPITLQLWLSEHNDNAQALNIFLADVQKALMVDVTRGGLAITTELGTNAATTDEAGRPLGVNQITVMIRYRTTLTDPTEAR